MQNSTDETRKKCTQKLTQHVSLFRFYNPFFYQGHGSKLIDECGNEYLDTRNNVAHVGHGNPAVVDAVSTQLTILNTNTRYLHPNVVRLAERLCGKMPDGSSLDTVVFVNSGSEANDLALRLARSYSKSKNTIVVDGAYHGHTLAVLEVSPYKYEHGKEFELTPNGPFSTPGKHIYKVPSPDIYRGEHRDADTAGAKYAAYVEDACQFYKNIHGESVGAFIIEGGMSVAGVILPPRGYLRKSVEAVRAAGGVYIADEVQTGFGRLGSAYWAFEVDSVVPDIVTVGKPFGNGMPLGAVITTKKIAAAFQEMGVEYFNTFGGNPVCASAGLAVLDVLERDGLQEHALEVGNYLKSRFVELKKTVGIIGDVRGSGLFMGIELVRDGETREAASEETSFICTSLKEKYKILSSIDGFNDNVIVVKPPLVFSKEDADHFVDSFEMATQDLQAQGHSVRNMAKTPT
jgi:ethanolamine-phosphate phospho-lyase